MNEEFAHILNPRIKWGSIFDELELSRFKIYYNNKVDHQNQQ